MGDTVSIEPMWVKWSPDGLPVMEWWLWGAVFLYAGRLDQDASTWSFDKGPNTWPKDDLRAVGALMRSGIKRGDIGFCRVETDNGSVQRFITPVADATTLMPPDFVHELAGLAAWLQALQHDLVVVGEREDGVMLLERGN